MKKLSLPILMCAVVGLTSMFLPNGGGPSMFGAFREFDSFRLVLMFLGFGLPAGLALWSLLGKPYQAWHGMVVMAGFAIVLVKAEVWTMFGKFTDLYLPMQLQAVAIVLGAVAAVVAYAKEADAATS